MAAICAEIEEIDLSGDQKDAPALISELEDEFGHVRAGLEERLLRG